MGFGLQDAQLQALGSRTEGWITGLHLLALAARGRVDVSEFIDRFTGSHRFIVDYLTDEVLSQQSEPVQRFLLQTSILTQLCGPLCDAVCFDNEIVSPKATNGIVSASRGQQLLEELDAANLFVVALDDERRWYRYHRLFADVLRHRLRRTLPQGQDELHMRAAHWYEKNGLVREAIDHALQAQDHGMAARLIEANAFPTLKRGKLTTLLRWIERLPETVTQSHPMILVCKAWALLLTGQVNQVEPLLRAAESVLGMTDRTVTNDGQWSQIGMESDEISGHICAIRTYVAAISGEPLQAIALGRRALALQRRMI